MKQRNKWFWVFFVIFVIAVGVGAGYYFGQKDREQVYEDLAEENKKPVIGEMISNFPVEELKRMITNVDRFDIDGITPEKEKAVEIEEKLDEISEKIIEENS